MSQHLEPCKDPGPHHLVSIDLIYEAAAEIERLQQWAREERRNVTNTSNAHADALNTISALTAKLKLAREGLEEARAALFRAWMEDNITQALLDSEDAESTLKAIGGDE